MAKEAKVVTVGYVVPAGRHAKVIINTVDTTAGGALLMGGFMAVPTGYISNLKPGYVNVGFSTFSPLTPGHEEMMIYNPSGGGTCAITNKVWYLGPGQSISTSGGSVSLNAIAIEEY